MSLLRNALFAGGTVSGLVYWAKSQMTAFEDKQSSKDQNVTEKTQEIAVWALKPKWTVRMKLYNGIAIDKLKEMLIATHLHNKAQVSIFGCYYPIDHQHPELAYMGGVNALDNYKIDLRKKNFIECKFHALDSNSYREIDFNSFIMGTTDPDLCFQLKDRLFKPNAFADEIESQRLKTALKNKKNTKDQKTQEIVVSALKENPIEPVAIKIMKTDPVVVNKLKEMLFATHVNYNSGENPNMSLSVFSYDILHRFNQLPPFVYIGSVASLSYFNKNILNKLFVKCVFPRQSPLDIDYESLIIGTVDSARCDTLRDELMRANAFADDLESKKTWREYKFI